MTDFKWYKRRLSNFSNTLSNIYECAKVNSKCKSSKFPSWLSKDLFLFLQNGYKVAFLHWLKNLFSLLENSKQFTVIVFVNLTAVVAASAGSRGSRSAREHEGDGTGSALSGVAVTSRGGCLSWERCRGTSRWRSSALPPPAPRTCARWRGRMGWRHRSWRRRHRGSRWVLHRPAPEDRLCCSAKTHKNGYM